MVGKVIAVILIIGLSAFVFYEVFGLIRKVIKYRKKVKKAKKVNFEDSTTAEVVDDSKHGESE